MSEGQATDQAVAQVAAQVVTHSDAQTSAQFDTQSDTQSDAQTPAQAANAEGVEAIAPCLRGECSTFLAWIVRMSLIKRWALMYNFRQENVSEHSHQTAVIAHMLAVIKNRLFNGKVDENKVAVLALYHEVSETKLQDLNSKTKYLNPEFTKQYKMLEHLAEQECINTLPQELQEAFKPLIIQNEVDDQLKAIVKAADTLSAYIKANDELRFNNQEFEHVKVGLDVTLEHYCELMPEVKYFMERFVPLCWATVDKLSNQPPTM